MSGGDMLQVAPPHEIYETPATAEVAAFVGRCNFLRGTVEQADGRVSRVRLSDGGDLVSVDSPATVSAGQDVTVAIRPEKLRIVPTDRPAGAANALETVVLTSSYVGSRYEYDLKLGHHVVQVESNRPGLRGPVALTFDPADALLYPEAVVPSEEVEELLTV
jgi:iron(III) transport system ATP-binding protein